MSYQLSCTCSQVVFAQHNSSCFNYCFIQVTQMFKGIMIYESGSGVDSTMYSTFLDAVSSGVSATPKSIPLSRGDAPRRSLNLDDYKKRRGLI